MRVVGENAADLGGTDKDRLRPRVVHPLLDLPLPREVDRFALDRQHLTVLTGKPAQQRAANHAAMARDPDFLAPQGIRAGIGTHVTFPSATIVSN